MIVDGHLDLAINSLNFGRDLMQPLAAIRAAEPQMQRLKQTPTVSIAALQQAGVGLALASLFVLPRSALKMYDVIHPEFIYDDTLPHVKNRQQAHAGAMQQLDYYHRLADEQEDVLLVTEWQQVEQIAHSMQGERRKFGIIVHMEGAQPIREPAEVEMWYERGLRSIGPAWDDTVYAPGQWRAGGRLPREGHLLLERMQSLNMLCDVTHMNEAATYDVLERYEGPICATHANAQALVPGARQITDRQIALLAEREAVIGVVLFNRFLRRGHSKGEPRERVTLEHVVAHIDHICQVVGDALHVGIGSDMDGGFGREDIPHELDSIADLPKLGAALQAYGYAPQDIANIMGGNWLRLLQRVLQR